MNQSTIKIKIYVFLICAALASCSSKEAKKENKIISNEINKKPDVQVIEINSATNEINFLDILQSKVLSTSQAQIDEIAKKFDENRLTDDDKKFIREYYNDIINFGGILYPEASITLKSYLYGNGDDVIIKSKYFFESDVIQKALNAGNGKSLIGPIKMNINDDPRIAYAINGFYIKNDNKNKEIYQRIEFGGKDNKEAYTTIYMPIGANKSIKLPHRLIRVFEEDGGCKSFTVRIIE